MIGKLEAYNSVGGSAFFDRLLAEWRLRGWSVSQVQGLDDAEYRKKRTWCGRVVLRLRMYGVYGWRCFSRARTVSPTGVVRVVTTNPFFAPALVKRFSREQGVTINLLYDLYPDALEIAGIAKPGSWLSARCATSTRYALSKCDATVFLGEHLRQHAELRYGEAKLGVVIPVGADGSLFPTFRRRKCDDVRPVTILYSGQMGRMHDVQTLKDAIVSCDLDRLYFKFYASGYNYSNLKKALVNTKRCEFGGALQQGDWYSIMHEADVAIVSVVSGAENVVMPSKTYSALVAGQAILAICSRKSDLADLVIKHDCGWVIEPGDSMGLNSVFRTIVGNPDELEIKRQNAYRAGHSYYDMSVIADQWEDLFKRLAA